MKIHLSEDDERRLRSILQDGRHATEAEAINQELLRRISKWQTASPR